MPIHDFIIVGQGLAGSLLAWRLMQRNQRVLILDNGLRDSASVIAAGIVNPVTGKRLVAPALIDTLLGTAHQLYRELETHFKRPFFTPLPMLRICQSEAELSYWRKRQGEPRYRHLFEAGLNSENLLRFSAAYGSFTQLQTGYLAIPELLHQLREEFSARDAYRRMELHNSQIEVRPHDVKLAGLHCRRLLFCTGFRAQENPWFSWLPFDLAQGDILSFETQVAMPTQIINAGKWLLPLDQHHFKFGSTFRWRPNHQLPSKAAATELLTALQRLDPYAAQHRLISQESGIRPGSRDKMPFIGLLQNPDRIGIFNGFGAKGSLLIPYYSAVFSDYLCDNAELPKEINLNRFHRSSPRHST